jgi:hypothetical protein
MEWTRPQYSKGQVDRAGRLLVDAASEREQQEALAIVNNWRVAHNFPLNTFQVTLRKRAQEIDASSLVAQRIKRMSSIDAKLRRFKGMRMSQMQDIGGCRGILTSIKQVTQLVDRYESSDIKHKLDDVDDYIAEPKSSGYRGVHMIYRYFSDREGPAVYNGLFVEMQLRTKLQHTWATAVETMGTFLRQPLKSSSGEEDWLRFFALVSSLFASHERCAPVPGTPEGRVLLKEIKEKERELSVRNVLSMYQHAIQVVGKEAAKKKQHYYLLVLEPQKMQMSVRGYARSRLVDASADYVAEEKRILESGGGGAEAVLVSVDSLANLERAYPNYFLDTSVFLGEVDRAVSQA